MLKLYAKEKNKIKKISTNVKLLEDLKYKLLSKIALI